jgi:esterase/lipase superfamily enzyme
MINQNIEERQTRNSQFDNQLEQVNTEEQFFTNVPEVGALISVQGSPFIGDGEGWVQLATMNDIPTYQNGYQVAYDTDHTNTNNAQNINAVEQVVMNNVGTSLGTMGCYDGRQFFFREGTIYTVTLSFTSLVTTNNAHAQLFFGYSGIPYNGDSDVLIYAKGNGVAHEFTRTFQIVGDSSTAEGIKLYIFPSHAGKVWGAKFTIQQAF